MKFLDTRKYPIFGRYCILAVKLGQQERLCVGGGTKLHIHLVSLCFWTLHDKLLVNIQDRLKYRRSDELF